MGSTGSRPRLCKVTPFKSPQEEGKHLKPQWTVPALLVTLEQPSGTLGKRKMTLPPLKQEISISTLSVCDEARFAGSLLQKQSNNSSIIHSHPPRRSQALLSPQIGHTSTANQIAMGCRDGGVHRFPTTGQTGYAGTGRMIQGGFLEAQMALTQQAHQQRQAQVQQAREQRRHKVVYTVNVMNQNTEGRQRMKLVRRPTERDIFWDESTGGCLDPSCLLQPKSHLREQRLRNQPNKQLLCKAVDVTDRYQGPKNRQEERTFQQKRHRGVFSDKNISWTTERETEKSQYKGETQSNSWIWPESARGCQTGRIRGARGIWDNKLE